MLSRSDIEYLKHTSNMEFDEATLSMFVSHAEALLVAYVALKHIHRKDFTASSSRIARTAIEDIESLIKGAE